ncbi:glycosyltransferase [Fischerella sp. PCC 9605]|uniref:glycosyltransferase n=1 Tax=Fischerella sp. PCC 9605 TaxID=1173024 RepID=UPI0004BB4FDB|nr:glycosyltransferase [Fischerella sp. PCC 9605]
MKNCQAQERKHLHLHLWFPDIFEFKGGIQTYSTFLLEALQRLYPKIEYEVFLKHDTQCLANFSFISNTRFHFAGTSPIALRTLVYATQILGRGLWKHPSLVIASHLNFTVAAYLLKRLIGTPYWTVAHGVEAWNIKSPALKTALHHADRILAVSNHTRDRLLKEQQLDPTKVSLLPNTFDVNRFQIAPKPQHLLNRHQLTRDQLVILTVARLDSSERHKGYDQILKALPEIRRQIPNIHYILVGKGKDRPRVEQLITQLGLQDCVTLAGFIPDCELCDYYNLCDVFAMPSKCEGFGIVYLEALACGKPVLAGNQDGAIDALCQGELGALVDPDNVADICQTLIKILQGNYPNPLMYQPQTLLQKVNDIYGFAHFQQRLAELLQHSPIQTQL